MLPPYQMSHGWAQAFAVALVIALTAPSLGQDGAKEGDAVPLPPIRPSFEMAPAMHPQDAGCQARLAKLGVEIDSHLAIAPPENAACLIAAPVVLISARNPKDAGKVVRFPDKPLLACALAERLAIYTFDTLSPLARETLDAEITAIGTGPGFECRPRNRQPGAKMSAHGQGLAFDIMNVELTGKSRVFVAKIEGEPQAIFVKRLLETACVAFNTVLGPAADRFHSDNIHIDLEPRGHDGKSKFCQ